MNQSVRGILRNAPSKYDSAGEPGELDRQQVLRNTHANARLSENGSAVAASVSKGYDGVDIKWDEANLHLTREQMDATMKVDEPKTPYQGHVGDSEYYKEDDIENLSLSEDIQSSGPHARQSQALQEAAHEEEEEADRLVSQESQHQPDDAMKKHMRFEELRRKHYKLKRDVLSSQEED